MSTAPDAISEAFIIKVKGLKVSGKARTSCLVNMVWISSGQVPSSRGSIVWWGPRGGKQCWRKRGWISSRSCKIWEKTIWPWLSLEETILRWLWIWLGPSVFSLFILSSQGTPLSQLRMYTSLVWGTSPVLRSIVRAQCALQLHWGSFPHFVHHSKCPGGLSKLSTMSCGCPNTIQYVLTLFNSFRWKWHSSQQSKLTRSSVKGAFCHSDWHARLPFISTSLLWHCITLVGLLWDLTMSNVNSCLDSLQLCWATVSSILGLPWLDSNDRICGKWKSTCTLAKPYT